MSKEKAGTPDKKTIQPLDGTAILSAASDAAATFFAATITELKDSIKTIVTTNKIDPEITGAMNAMTKDLVQQLEDRLTTIFPKPKDGNK